jgi:hypothetical protein
LLVSLLLLLLLLPLPEVAGWRLLKQCRYVHRGGGREQGEQVGREEGSEKRELVVVAERRLVKLFDRCLFADISPASKAKDPRYRISIGRTYDHMPSAQLVFPLFFFFLFLFKKDKKIKKSIPCQQKRDSTR